ncbi:hypothetical protein cypCar_00027584 [Cyprinus carpio]|nr:hypothetical protein cypCar_00027584 [Cyprinus carpio]
MTKLKVVWCLCDYVILWYAVCFNIETKSMRLRRLLMCSCIRTCQHLSFLLKYSIVTPENLKDIANAFRKSLKAKLKLNPGIKLKNAEKKKKPSEIDLVFFSVVSRTGTDIDAALSKITHSKPVILVVLHHTFDPEAVVSNSSKFLERKHTFAVDCLFYEDKGLLKCKRNDKACEDAMKWLKSKKELFKHNYLQEKSGK